MSISWLLLKKSVEQSSGRLLLTASAIALGFMLIAVFTAAVNATTARQDHSVWRGFKQAPIKDRDPLLVELTPTGNLNKWKNTTIDTTSVHATGDTSPQIASLPTPKEGEYYTSKALGALIENNPDERIGARFGSVHLGTIPDKYTGSPDELAVIRGMSEAEASNTTTAKVFEFVEDQVPSPTDGLVGFILVFGGIILLFPIVLFLVIATQLGSAQREKRYAAMRLVGATQGQVTRIMALESLMATLAGIVLGTIAYLVVRGPMAQFYYEGERFWPSDISIAVIQYVSLASLTIILSLGATWWSMRRIRTSPLGVVRDQKVNKKPHLWRLAPLATGLLIFAFITTRFGQKWLNQAMVESSTPLLLLIVGIILIMVGFIWAGPWITASLAKLFSNTTHNAQVLIATKRIAGNSTQIFRSVSGVVLALFAGSFYLTAVSGMDDLDAQAITNNGYSLIKPGSAFVIGSPLPVAVNDAIDAAPYTIASAPVYTSERGNVIQCANLTTHTKLNCPKGVQPSEFVTVNFEEAANQKVTIVNTPSSESTRDYLVQLDNNESIDKLRTLIATQINDDNRPGYVISGTYAQIAITDPVVKELAGLAYIGMAVTLLVAISSLIVSTIGGLLERKKSLMTLRLGGMTISQMKQVVMIESLIPLVVVSLVAASIGVWVGTVFINTLSTSVEPSLSPIYFVIITGALIIAALSIFFTLPILSKLTSYEENRTE